jgi:phosphorylcholine metabolism protein LicD
LQLVESTKFRQPRVSAFASYDGPYIDIFTVDSIARTSGPRYSAQKLMIRGLRRLLFMKTGFSRQIRRKPWVRLPMYAISRVIPTRAVHALVVWAQSKFNSSGNATHWANVCTYYDLDREVFPREWFGEGKRVMFDDLSLLVPNEAEQMLTSIYGPKYMQIPAGGAQSARLHSFIVDRDHK